MSRATKFLLSVFVIIPLMTLYEKVEGIFQ